MRQVGQTREIVTNGRTSGETISIAPIRHNSAGIEIESTHVSRCFRGHNRSEPSSTSDGKPRHRPENSSGSLAYARAVSSVIRPTPTSRRRSVSSVNIPSARPL